MYQPKLLPMSTHIGVLAPVSPADERSLQSTRAQLAASSLMNTKAFSGVKTGLVDMVKFLDRPSLSGMEAWKVNSISGLAMT